MATGSGNHSVFVEEKNFTRTLTLNRPWKLNAVTSQMLRQLCRLLLTYDIDSSVKLVVVKGCGRAFCAGGDIGPLVQKVNQGAHWRAATPFFWNEFRLDYIIATHRKPQVSILNGIVMGTGAGISMNGMFRIATDNTLFSMPETLLGGAPTAGGSYFLSRLPGFFGEYLGLTGARLDGAEMLACGLATHFVSSNKLEALEEALSQVDTSDPRIISLIIDEFSLQQPSLKENSVYNRLDIVDECFCKGTVEEIIHACLLAGEGVQDEWLCTAIGSFKKASPIALKFTLRSLRRGRDESIGECLFREYRMMGHALRGELSRDLMEGCRATFIDKDRSPRWEPSCLELVSDEMVEEYFTKLDDEYWADLDLYLRPSSHVVYAAAKL